MNTRNELAGHSERTLHVIHVSTSRTESRFATERDIFEFATVRACIESTTMRRITTVNHLGDVFEFGLTRMKFIKDMLIIINKNI